MAAGRRTARWVAAVVLLISGLATRLGLPVDDLENRKESLVPGVGQTVAEQIVGFFSEPHNREVIDKLLAAGVHWETPPAPTAARSASLARRGTGAMLPNASRTSS